MVHFVGAGPGAPDLITRRGAALLQEADCIIYAGSLVNPALLGLAKPECAVYNSAEMTLEQVLDVMRRVEAAGGTTVRLHTGDPCLYGAIREQMDAVDARDIPWDVTPGVSSTMERRRPMILLNSMDLPTLGRPTMAIRGLDIGVYLLLFGCGGHSAANMASTRAKPSSSTTWTGTPSSRLRRSTV